MDIKFESSNKMFGMEKGMIKVLAVPLAAGILFLLSFMGIALPRVNEIKELNNEKLKVETKTKTVKEKRDYFTKIDKEELNEKSDYASKALVKEKNSYFLVGMVRKLAEQYSFQVQAFSVSPGKLGSKEAQTVKKGSFLKMPLNVSLVGPKEKYLDLMLEFENRLPILSVDSFEMKTANEAAELDLSVSAYYAVDESEANIANMDLSELTLNKEEEGVIGRLRRFGTMEIGAENDGEGEYLKYQRENPFTL